MKAFKDLQKGDKIYYWDKGKLHEQIVHEIEIKDEVSSYTDWSGKVTEQHREVVNIVAGKNNRTKLNLYWDAKQSIIRRGYMIRFSCIESANYWLEQQRNWYDRKIKYLENRIARMKKWYSAYSNPEIREAKW